MCLNYSHTTNLELLTVPIGFDYHLNMNLSTIASQPLAADKSANIQIGVFANKQVRAPVKEILHRHNFQELIWIESGYGRHSVDGRTFEIGPESIALIAKHCVHIFDEAVDLTGCYIRFTDDFFAGDRTNTATLFDQFKRCETIAITLSESASFKALYQLITAECRVEGVPRQADLLHDLIHALLIKIERLTIDEQQRHDGLQSSESARIYQYFLELLEVHFRQYHTVAYYAALIQVSAEQLTKLLLRTTGKSAKQLIEARLMLDRACHALWYNRGMSRKS